MNRDLAALQDVEEVADLALSHDAVTVRELFFLEGVHQLLHVAWVVRDFMVVVVGSGDGGGGDLRFGLKPTRGTVPIATDSASSITALHR